ncbi:hypothetical protein JAAARDRAFT_140434 [Jaapia argillacea MUCL 33604]|uniref:Branched-chain-amino-acid aminotransferase n=1 Tax=Jaapia argillacea MUCL 33604 TaxID=933084 RepID=A0A067P973_9AGAM|nr:hypothetical protein JAAARDRAFT_140434 [Jaapia argillacea MUCL 33604]
MYVPTFPRQVSSHEISIVFRSHSIIQASKLKITLAETLKPLVPVEDLQFGQTMTDHMMVATYDPINGWSAPEIKPYGPLTLDPASSCFQYCPNVFEGMKAYMGPDGKARLFRPQLNMARMEMSAARVALPLFNSSALLTLIKKLVAIERRWIPTAKGCSLYIRPTIIGTRAALGVAASDHATLYILCSPTGPYFRSPPPSLSLPTQKPNKTVSLLAVSENVRSWPGGTGGFKLGLNYAPGFAVQKVAAEKGYAQVLWLLPEVGEGGKVEMKVTEAGAMNFFVVVKRDDGGMDVITPPLDGTILPGLTRASVLSLCRAHTSSPSSSPSLPSLPPSLNLHIHERPLTMTQLLSYSSSGTLLEAFGVGTAVIVAPIGKIGYQEEGKVGETVIELPVWESEGGLGVVGEALWERIVGIQEGRVEWEGWSVVCE